MANMKKTKKTEEMVETTEPVTEDVIEVKASVETPNKIKTKAPSVKKFEDNEAIPCKSITSGGLYMTGSKSRVLYEWVDNGDVTEVEYKDLIAAVRANSSYVMKPYFIIEDEEFVRQNPKLKKVYDTMYSFKDLKDILALPVGAMKTTILSLPEGGKESIKHIASQMVSNGTLDSLNKIKVLDELFNTQLVLLTGLFNE